jgi:hypothetical protein
MWSLICRTTSKCAAVASLQPGAIEASNPVQLVTVLVQKRDDRSHNDYKACKQYWNGHFVLFNVDVTNAARPLL